jgi:hypothetical protein
MDLDKGNKARAGNRNEWVEPMVTEINVAETAANPTTGPDGGIFPDCSHS